MTWSNRFCGGKGKKGALVEKDKTYDKESDHGSWPMKKGHLPWADFMVHGVNWPNVNLLHPKLRNIHPHNVTCSLISRNPRERMFVVQISLLIVTLLSLISWILSLMQITKEVNRHPHIAPCVNMWSVTFLFFFFFFSSYATCWMLVHAYATLPRKAKWSGPHHNTPLKCCTLCYSIMSHATLIH